MKRFVTHVSLNGFKTINNLAWYDIAIKNDKINDEIDISKWNSSNDLKKGKENFCTNWYDRDKQNVPQAALFFSSSVESKLRANGNATEADFCLLIREFFEVYDKSGISQNCRIERVQKFLDYFEHDFLMHLYSIVLIM